MNINPIIRIIQNLENKKELEDFLVGILTPSEIEQILTRIKIVKMLKKGKPQHEIAKELGIGVSTVSRGSNMLKKGRFKYVK